MFGNVVRHALGFGMASRGKLAPETLPNDADVVRLEPVGRKLPEKRSIPGESVTAGRLSLIIGSPSSSGAPVNESSALGVSAVTACVSLIADMIAKLPIYLYKDTPTGPVEILNHPGIKLIGGIPSEMHTSFELRQLMESGKGLGGNGYARVFRDSTFEPYSIQWIEPCRVTPRLFKKTNGERFVLYDVEDMGNSLTRSDIIHIKWMSQDGIAGLSPIRLLRESIGTALSQTTAAGKLMLNGAKWPGFITVDGITKPEQIAGIRDEINLNMSGAMNAGRIPVVGGSLKFQQTNGMSMVDAQFVESRRFELQEIARLYRIPPFMIGDSTASTTWGTGIEQQTLGFLNFCLDSHLVGWEQSLALTLLTTQEQKKGYYFKFDRDELANVALEARASFYQTMRNIGVFSPNDVLRKLGEPLIAAKDGGDDYGRPFNASGGTPQPQAKPEPEPVTP